MDGPQSFQERDKVIAAAQKSIHLLSWAVYDDVTGEKYSNILIRKLRDKKEKGEPFEVKVMVDGLTARNPPYAAQLKKMEEAGIEVIRWRSTDSKRPYDGQHRKAMIIDGQTSIEGGMNFGDEYSHLGPPTSPKWRDTDILISGYGAQPSSELFQKLWNEQIDKRAKKNWDGSLSLDGFKLNKLNEHPQTNMTPDTGPRVSLVNHQPTQGENIYRAVLLAIKTAKRSVDIENAYFILDPVIHQALIEAKRKGVRVRVLTNSLESIDVPEMAYLMTKSVNTLVKEGFEIYTKKGATLHSKFFIVDEALASVGSYNFHPRSHRYEGEIIRNVFDTDFVKSTRETFESDIHLDKAYRITKPIPLNTNPTADIISQFFFDQL